MKRRKATQKTPMKQTKISSFFNTGEPSVKRLCTNDENSPIKVSSPDVILCTPPEKNSGKARRSLLDRLDASLNNNASSKNLSKVDSAKENARHVLEVESSNTSEYFANDFGSSKTMLKTEKVQEKPRNNFKDQSCNALDELDSAYFEISQPSEVVIDVDTKSSVKKHNSPKKPLQNSNDDNIFPNFDDFVFDDGWDSGKQSQEVYDLCFDQSTFCEVVSTDFRSKGLKHEQILIVKSKVGEKYGRCVLRDMWALNKTFCVGDSLSVFGYLDSQDWVVDAQKGYVCLYPEILVSSTSLVGAMFCRRRAVLSNYFKGLDSDNKIMLIGKLVHEILQMSLDKPSCSSEDLEKVIDQILLDPINLRSLYSSDISVEEAKRDFKKYIPFIINFLKTYVKGETQSTGKNFKGLISDIIDIEEDICCPSLGVKGRIDVTVNAKIGGLVKKMPLELKTGKASFSAEHKNQVFLYVIMMSELGERVESGLLLYLKEGIMEEIKPTATEIRDLVLLRNDFAQYLRRFDAKALPDPIKFIKACQKCPYATICNAFLTENIPENHPIRELKISFPADHLAYFHKWTQLLIMEDSFESLVDDMRLTDLILKEGVVRLKNEFKYTFIRENTLTSLKGGNFVVVTSENKRYTGRIVDISSKHCSVAFPKEIANKRGKFEISGLRSSLLTKYLSNLGEFMEESHVKLRNIIIKKECPTIKNKLPKSYLKMDCLKILAELNEDQQRGILKVLSTDDYLLIEGPPGTGKTQTIAAMIKILVLLNNSVLLVGHTHSSVDNVLLRLQDVDFLRLGNLSSMKPSLHSKSYAFLSQNAKSVEDVASLLNKPVIGSTCLGLDADIVSKKKFDVCIIDESSQVLQPEALKPLFCAKKFVLIGDPKQLRPVVRNPMAKSFGMDESIFERLYQQSSFVSLTIQYRMNKAIMGLVNALSYEHKLKAGSPVVENKTLSLKTINISEKWLMEVLSTDINKSLVFINTSNYIDLNPENSFSCSNLLEVKLAKKIVDSMLESGVPKDDVGVMAPYREQIAKLKELLPENVEINTVDQYQGRDKDVILFSCTRVDRQDKEKRENEILNDVRRFTVSVSRAKCKLIIIGDKDTLVKYKTFERLFLYLSDVNFVTLKEGKNDFSWNSFRN